MKTAAAQTRTKFQNVLFATDFSAAAAHAIPFAKRIAQHYESSVFALHVRPPVVNPMTQAGTWPADLEAAKAIDEGHRRDLLDRFAGISTKVTIEEGDILSSLNAAVARNNIDLVVIGTRGRTGLGKLLLGSVAEEIFRNVDCPVMTIGPSADAARAVHGEFREILYATDFKSDPQATAAYAVSLAQEFQSRLTLMHVVAEARPGDLVAWCDVRDSSKELLLKLVPPGAEAWCKPECFVERGDPAERILDLANLRDVDLIVLGLQPESGVPGAATHLPVATAHKVVSRAKCPVLTVRGK